MDKITINMNQITIPGLAHVEIVDQMGNDLKVVNAARGSFNVTKKELGEDDVKLIKYLAREFHTAPFRHCYVTYVITCPEFVARQIYKHVVGIAYCEFPINDHGWSEVSGRYIEAWELGYHVPDELRVQAKSSKQASITDTENKIPQTLLIDKIKKHNEDSVALSKELRSHGVCKEQSREVLTLATNTKWTWTLSLQALAHMIHLRDDSHAQGETQQIIKGMYDITVPIFCPISLNALIDEFNKRKTKR